MRIYAIGYIRTCGISLVPFYFLLFFVFSFDFLLLSIVQASTIETHAKGFAALSGPTVKKLVLFAPSFFFIFFCFFFFCNSTLSLFLSLSLCAHRSHDSYGVRRLIMSELRRFRGNSALRPRFASSSATSFPSTSFQASLLLAGNREYFAITVCIKSSRTFNGRSYRPTGAARTGEHI